MRQADAEIANRIEAITPEEWASVGYFQTITKHKAMWEHIMVLQS